MTVDVDGVINLLNIIASEEQVKTCVKQSFKGSLIAGVGAFLGGIMGGPPGLLVGGALGSGMGFMATRDQFVSIPAAVEELPYYRKEAIASHIQLVIDRLDQGDLIALTQLAISVATGGTRAVMQNQILSSLVRDAIVYVQNQVAEEQRVNPDFLRQ